MLIIGIAGGSGSGKTTVVKAITDQLKERVVVIPQDSYYKDLSHCTEQEKKEHNFDHPDSIDFDLLCQHLKELKEGKTIEQPVYSYITCSRSADETVTVAPADVIIVEGILIFTCAKLRKQLDIKLFVDADDGFEAGVEGLSEPVEIPRLASGRVDVEQVGGNGGVGLGCLEVGLEIL